MKRFKSSTETWYSEFDSLFEVKDELIPLDSPLAFTFHTSWTQDLLVQCAQRWWFTSLRVLNVHVPVYIDHDPPKLSLIMTAQDGCVFPQLEAISLRNQGLVGIRMHEQHAPRLRAVRIQHPCGVPIEMFDVQSPMLEEVSVSYATILDGYGLQRSIDCNRNPKLRIVERFATTIYLNGMV